MEKPIETIMSKELVTLKPGQKLVEAKHIFERRKFHHHIPVVENNELVGMLSLHDFLYAAEGAGLNDDAPPYQGKTVGDVMSAHPVSLTSASSIREAAEMLAKNEIHALVIVDGKKPVGIVSTADLLRYMLNR